MRGRTIEPGTVEYCTPFCRFFRCSNKSLLITRDKRICKLVDDDCDPLPCKFPMCSINKLLPDGRCGVYVERVMRRKRRVSSLERINISDIEDYDKYVRF